MSAATIDQFQPKLNYSGTCAKAALGEGTGNWASEIAILQLTKSK